MTLPPEGQRGDGRPGEGIPLPPDLVIPDDARDLEHDRLALLREQAVARRRTAVARLVFTRRWHQHGISGPIVAICLLIVFVFAALLALVVPGAGNARQPSLPLARSSVPAGRVLSLLPDEELTGVGRHPSTLRSRSLRPGVVLVIPAGCSAGPAAAAACAAAVADVTGPARDFGLTTWLVGRKGDISLPGLAETPTVGTYAVPFADPGGRVLAAYPATALPTGIFIDGSGVVRTILPNITGSMSITSVLDRLSGLAD